MFAFNLCILQTNLEDIYMYMTHVQARKPKYILKLCATLLIKDNFEKFVEI